MSTLETNSIGKYSGNNVSVDDALNLKSYTTVQRDALTSVAGDVIYNSDDAVTQYYNGTSWQSMQDPRFNVDFLLIAGGGGGGMYYGAGGGAGGYICSMTGENSGGLSSAVSKLQAENTTNYTVTIGAGGAAQNSYAAGNDGSNSVFNITTAIGGGGGGGSSSGASNGRTGGSGGGAGGTGGGTGGTATSNQGFNGGNAGTNAAGGGGGAGQVGAPSVGSGGTHEQVDGGDGIASSITGISTYRAGGGASSGALAGSGSGGLGGGGDGAVGAGSATAGTVNTGSGGGGGSGGAGGAAGGSGIVILRYPNSKTITIGAGLTAGTETTDGSDKYIEITAGTGTVSWS
jgi:hypothetical protein